MNIRHAAPPLILASALLGTLAQAAQPLPARSLVESNTVFACDLYAQLKSSPGNLFFSPYSISSCLAMTYAGARSNTEKQMAQVLHFGTRPGQDASQVCSAFGALQRQLRSTQQQAGIELNIANALWAQTGHPFLPAFLNTGKSDFQASLGQADFRTGAEAARNQINQWVAGQTRNKITGLLPPGSLNEATRLVLANAIYFKGLWDTPFPKARTSNQAFYVSATHLLKVPLMQHLDQVRYMENAQFQAVELPYRGGELSMVVLLPRQKEGCGNLENQLSAALLSKTRRQMQRQEVSLFLPRFKLEASFALKDTLSQMGMAEAFSPQADFSGMDGARDLFLTDVFHKAWVEVNEEGTEAAAATAIPAASRAAARPQQQPPVFRADHPFLFLIRDTRLGSVLFLGRLAAPAK
jgi:serine protease inhibitor